MSTDTSLVLFPTYGESQNMHVFHKKIHDSLALIALSREIISVFFETFKLCQILILTRKNAEMVKDHSMPQLVRNITESVLYTALEASTWVKPSLAEKYGPLESTLLSHGVFVNDFADARYVMIYNILCVCVCVVCGWVGGCTGVSVCVSRLIRVACIGKHLMWNINVNSGSIDNTSFQSTILMTSKRCFPEEKSTSMFIFLCS